MRWLTDDQVTNGLCDDNDITDRPDKFDDSAPLLKKALRTSTLSDATTTASGRSLRVFTLPAPDDRHVQYAWASKAGKSIGNSSWMNAIFHSVSHLADFSRFLLDTLDAPKLSNNGGGGELVQALAGLQSKIWAKDSATLDPRPFLRTISNLAMEDLSPEMRTRFKNQDSQVLLSFCLERLHKEIASQSSSDSAAVAAGSGPEARQQRRMALRDRLEGRRRVEQGASPITDMFQGQQYTTICCNRCGAKSRRFAHFMTLTVPMSYEESSVADVIERLLGEELPEENIRWDCQECGEDAEAVKKVTIAKLPNVLALHLKRTKRKTTLATKSSDSSGSLIEARSISTCSAASFGSTNTEGSGAIFDVVGVVDRSEDRYTAKCLSGTDGLQFYPQWNIFDGESVRPHADGQDILGPDTHTVFLARRPASTRCDSPMRSPRKMMRARQLLQTKRGYISTAPVKYTLSRHSLAKYSRSSQASTDCPPWDENSTQAEVIDSDSEVSDCGTEDFNIWGDSDTEEKFKFRLQQLHPRWHQ
jgi:ubiquitin carboxyl-terminal hydrolase 8